MLADAPLPHGSGANLAVVGTLSEGFGRIVASPPYLVGYVRWDARSDRFTSLCQTIFFDSFTDRTLALSQKELQRVNLISSCAKGDMVCARAAELLSLSVRQVKRLTKTFWSGE